MECRDADLLVRYMETADYSQARLARRARTTRQFVHLLATGQRKTCSKEVADRIEEALHVLPGTIFMPRKSPTTNRNGSKSVTIA